MAEDRKDAFFLDPDEALSLGDVEYMRKTVKVKRTFPKAKGGGELVQEVSATQAKKVGAEAKTATPAPSTPAAPVSFEAKAPTRTSTLIPDPVVIPTTTPASGDTLEQVKSFSEVQAPVNSFPSIQFVPKEDRQRNDSNLNLYREMGLSKLTKKSSDRQRGDSYLDPFRKMVRRSSR